VLADPVPPVAAGGYRVRPASPADVRPLAALYRGEAEFHQRLAGYYHLQPQFNWHAFVRGRIEGPDRAVMVAEREGALAGFIFVRAGGYQPSRGWRHWLRGIIPGIRRSPGLPLQPLRWGVIEDCFVAEPARRQGIGEALVAGASRWFAGRGIHRVELAVLYDNPDAARFWTRLGFAPFRVSMWRDVGEGGAPSGEEPAADAAGRAALPHSGRA
jgi:GNAT superfamily N-acetyltransferase